MQIITDPFQKELKEHGSYQFPFLVSHERLERYETGSFLWHWHPQIELTLITQGEMIYRFNGRVFHPGEGDALFGNASALHAGEMFEHHTCAYTSVTFDPRLIYGYENSLIHRKYVEPLIQNCGLPGLLLDRSAAWHDEAIHLIQEVIHLDANRKPLYELEIIRNLQAFWKLLFLGAGDTASSSPAEQQRYGRIRQMLDYMEKHYAEKIYLEDIAAQAGLCKSECCRQFRHSMGISLFEFLLEYRIERSLDTLMQPGATVMEAAGKSGFGDSNYYSKVFRRVKGCSPIQYRRKLAED